MSKILLVEAKPTMRKILERAIIAAGFADVVSVEDGEAALDRFMRDEFVLIVADWRLPKMGGAELIRRIRERNSFVSIFIVTEDAGREQVQAAVDLDVSDYLVKPFTADCLAERLAKIKTRVLPETPAK